VKRELLFGTGVMRLVCGGRRQVLGALFSERAWKWPVSLLMLVILAALVAQASQSGQGKPAGPLDERQVEGLVRGGVYSGRIAHLVAQRGIDFKPSQTYLQTLRKEGAQEVLIQALVAASPSDSSSVGESPNVRAARLSSTSTHNESSRPAMANIGNDKDSAGVERARLTDVLSLAEEYGQRKQWAAAERQYRDAISLKPDRAFTYVALGRVLIAENDAQVAIQQYRKAINLQPDLADAHRALGNILIKTGDTRQGVSEYRAALRLNPSDTELRAKLAALLYSMGDLESAVAEYRTLQMGNPNDPDIHYRLGVALYCESDLPAAAAQFHEALRLDPAFTQAHGALGDVLLKQGDRFGALEEYRKAAGSADPALRGTFDWLANDLKH
jgi:tetratricopeptide (TPR) repeat protein